MPADPPSPPDAAFPALRDFSDRLPAVLVKELRQGLRGRMFVVGFCVLHGLLATNVAVTFGTSSTGSFFWLCLTVMFIFLLPSRNLGALGEERQEKTLDTLILTRLTPWRIVWGKWSATAALAALTAVSVLPYLLMRYLSGGTQFIGEAVAVVVLFLCFCGLTGIFTAASIVRSPIVRNGFALAAAIAAYNMVAAPMVALFTDPFRDGISGGQMFTSLLLLLLTTCWVTFYFLWQAAGSIAPLTANTAAPRRLITLGVYIAAVVPPLSSGFFGQSFSTFLLLVAGFTEMGERQPPAHIPFVWRGPLRPLAVIFFAPGWASGLCFTALLCILRFLVDIILSRAPDGLFSGIVSVSYQRWPLIQTIPVICAPLLYRLLLPQSLRWGAAPLFLLALVSHLGGLLLNDLFDGNLTFLSWILPGLHNAGMDLEWGALSACLWAALATAFALPGLKVNLQRGWPRAA